MVISLCLDRIIFPAKGRYIISGHEKKKIAEDNNNVKTDDTEGKKGSTEEYDQQLATLTDVDAVKKHRRLILKILKIIYSIIGASIMVSMLLLIGLTAFGSIVFRSYDHNEASRVASMIVVAFCAATGVALAVYGITTVIKNSKSALHKISIMLIILAIMMLVLAVFTIHMSTQDEVLVLRSMHRSLKLAHFHSPLNEKQWNNIQNQLECCGIYGPEDYRREGQSGLAPPEITPSCCISYDADQTTSSQFIMKEVCRRQGTYYTGGCRAPVIQTLMSTSDLVYGMCIIVVVFLVVQGPLGILLSKVMIKWWQDIVVTEVDEKPPNTELIVPAV